MVLADVWWTVPNWRVPDRLSTLGGSHPRPLINLAEPGLCGASKSIGCCALWDGALVVVQVVVGRPILGRFRICEGRTRGPALWRLGGSGSTSEQQRQRRQQGVSLRTAVRGLHTPRGTCGHGMGQNTAETPCSPHLLTVVSCDGARVQAEARMSARGTYAEARVGRLQLQSLGAAERLLSWSPWRTGSLRCLQYCA